MKGVLIDKIVNRTIVLKGIGKLFYQDGFPIAMAVMELQKHGIEVSLFHAADECMKNGWSAKTVVSKFKEDFADSQEKLDVESLTTFCNSAYDIQRQMIFDNLFNNDRTEAIRFIKTKT